jgi:putative DNA-invertase from lambdoid prophage Rac
MILSYCRVSTSEQAAGDATSLAEQHRKNKALALIRSSGEFDVGHYVDAGVPGSIPLKDRPAGSRMLEDAQAGDVIVATKLDRLFRSAVDALQTLAELQARKVDVILIDIGTEPLATSGVAKLFLTMLAAFAEFERTRIAERITEGKKAKQERGGHTGGEAPYGYRLVGKGRESRLEPNPDEQSMIRLAKDLWLQQRLGPAAVCREFEKRGLRDRAGSSFRPWQLQRMVKRDVINGQP